MVFGFIIIAVLNRRAGEINAPKIANATLSENLRLGERLYFRFSTINCCRNAKFSAIMALLPAGLQSIMIRRRNCSSCDFKMGMLMILDKALIFVNFAQFYACRVAIWHQIRIRHAQGVMAPCFGGGINQS